MDIKDLNEALMKEWAAKAMESLDEETKKQLVTNAVYNLLDKADFTWEIRKVFEEQAQIYAAELVKTEGVQKRIKEKVHEALEGIMDEMFEHSRSRMLQGLKWSLDDIKVKGRK